MVIVSTYSYLSVAHNNYRVVHEVFGMPRCVLGTSCSIVG